MCHFLYGMLTAVFFWQRQFSRLPYFRHTHCLMIISVLFFFCEALWLLLTDFHTQFCLRICALYVFLRADCQRGTIICHIVLYQMHYFAHNVWYFMSQESTIRKAVQKLPPPATIRRRCKTTTSSSAPVSSSNVSDPKSSSDEVSKSVDQTEALLLAQHFQSQVQLHAYLVHTIIS